MHNDGAIGHSAEVPEIVQDPQRDLSTRGRGGELSRHRVCRAPEGGSFRDLRGVPGDARLTSSKAREEVVTPLRDTKDVVDIGSDEGRSSLSRKSVQGAVHRVQNEDFAECGGGTRPHSEAKKAPIRAIEESEARFKKDCVNCFVKELKGPGVRKRDAESCHLPPQSSFN
jgi:hypothetical protein